MVASPEVALVAATAVHLGFQATVTLLVYPALADLGRTRPEAWRAAHERHARRITPLVGAVYGALALASAWVLVAAPSAPGVVAVASTGTAVLLTAVGAAPTHGRLTEPAEPLLRRLLAVDRWRTAAAAGALAAALVACAG